MKPTAEDASACANPAMGIDGKIKKPTKEQVREWLTGRLARPAPLPSLEQIRHELGWVIIEPQRSPAVEAAEPAC